jgi:Protein of unknown function (DUF3105)
MSLSTPSEPKNPNVVKVGGKPAAKPAAKPGSRPGGKTTPTAKGKSGGPRKPITPVKVGGGRNWGPIALFGAVILVALGIIVYAAWPSFKPGGSAYSWEARANQIDGVQNFRKNGPALSANHKWGPIQYPQSPPVGGDHIPPPVWQQCMGNVYEQQIPNEHAVHSMEHGAVWVTYRPDLPAGDVKKLTDKIKGKQYTMISPYEGLDHKVSLQAWGYQLKLDDVNDSRIDDFIGALAKNAAIEPGATCSGGTTAVGTTPLTEEQAQRQFGG